MFYSSILYYPYVGVMDSPWLKNSLLFWNKIYVIMPKDFDFKRYGAKKEAIDLNKKLRDEGVLIPITVGPDHSAVRSASETFGRRLKQGVLGSWRFDKKGEKQRPLTQLHPGKITKDLYLMFEEWRNLTSDIEERISYEENRGKLLRLPNDIVSSYMSLLASEIATRRRLAIGTDDEEQEQYMLDIAHPIVKNMRSLNNQNAEAKGYLSHLLLTVLDIGNNDIKKILGIRKKYEDEINAFRAAIGDIFSDIPDDLSKKDLRLYFRDCWKNEIEPAINNLKKSVNAAKLSTGLGLLKTATLSTATSLAGIAVAGPIGMTLGAVVPIAFELGERLLAHREKEQNNPFSVVMKVRGDRRRPPSFDEEDLSDFPRHWERLGLPLPR